mmetsp:Transcript_26610/g.81781  ORF Transcript_26610/g.81781 Transcript_26610/m.81781 type:complete len:334 (+) Transcript_26610:771-1772(+)
MSGRAAAVEDADERAREPHLLPGKRPRHVLSRGRHASPSLDDRGGRLRLRQIVGRRCGGALPGRPRRPLRRRRLVQSPDAAFTRGRRRRRHALRPLVFFFFEQQRQEPAAAGVLAQHAESSQVERVSRRGGGRRRLLLTATGVAEGEVVLVAAASLRRCRPSTAGGCASVPARAARAHYPGRLRKVVSRTAQVLAVCACRMPARAGVVAVDGGQGARGADLQPHRRPGPLHFRDGARHQTDGPRTARRGAAALASRAGARATSDERQGRSRAQGAAGRPGGGDGRASRHPPPRRQPLCDRALGHAAELALRPGRRRRCRRGGRQTGRVVAQES